MLGNLGGYQQLFMGVIMAQCYGIILRFQGSGTWSSVEHPGSADLSRTNRSEGSYRKCRAGGWECEAHAGANASPQWVSKTVPKSIGRL